MEGQDLFGILAANYEGSNMSLPRSSKTCQELPSVNGALLSTTHMGQSNNTFGVKQDEYHSKAKVPSSTDQKAYKDESEQFVDKQVASSSQAMFPGEVNSVLIRRSKNRLNHGHSSINNYVSNAASGDKLEENHLSGVMNYLYSLRYTFWDMVTLLFLLVDVMFGFVGRRPSIVIGVTISIILGVAIPMYVLTSNNDPPPNPFQYDFPTLMYGISRSLMFLSLVLQTQRDRLSHLMAGAAYSCAVLFILGYNFSLLTLNYACCGVAVLLSFVLFAMLYGNTQDGTDEI